MTAKHLQPTGWDSLHGKFMQPQFSCPSLVAPKSKNVQNLLFAHSFQIRINQQSFLLAFLLKQHQNSPHSPKYPKDTTTSYLLA